MNLPEKAQELLDMIRMYADLQDSNQVMIPHKDLGQKFSTGEVELAEHFLLKNKILVSARTKEMPSGSLSGCLALRDEILKSPEHPSAEADFYVHGMWTHDAIAVYELAKSASKAVQKLSFDDRHGVLTIRGESIKIDRKNDITNAHELLRYIFKNVDGLKAQSFYSEMTDELLRGTEWKKYYRACDDIQEKVRKGTVKKNDDFLIYTTGITGSVRINPKYL